VSAVANTDEIRSDESKEGQRKEKGLNLAANIMAGVTTAASLASTILGAVSIAELDKSAEAAKRCAKAVEKNIGLLLGLL
jgi:hypothetical protein